MVTWPVADTLLHSFITSDMFSTILSSGNFVAQSFVPTWTVISENWFWSKRLSILRMSPVLAPPRDSTTSCGLLLLMSRMVESPIRRAGVLAITDWPGVLAIRVREFICVVRALFWSRSLVTDDTRLWFCSARYWTVCFKSIKEFFIWASMRGVLRQTWHTHHADSVSCSYAESTQSSWNKAQVASYHTGRDRAFVFTMLQTMTCFDGGSGSLVSRGQGISSASIGAICSRGGGWG